MYCSCLAAFNIYLVFRFQQFYCSVNFFVFIFFGVCWSSWICVCPLPNLGSFQLLFLQICFLSNTISSLSGTLMTQISEVWYYPTGPWGSVYLFFPSFFCFSDWIISINWSLSSLFFFFRVHFFLCHLCPPFEPTQWIFNFGYYTFSF